MGFFLEGRQEDDKTPGTDPDPSRGFCSAQCWELFNYFGPGAHKENQLSKNYLDQIEKLLNKILQNVRETIQERLSSITMQKDKRMQQIFYLGACSYMLMSIWIMRLLNSWWTSNM